MNLVLPQASRSLLEDGNYEGKRATFILSDGSRRADVRHGDGRCVYSDGSVYEGRWDDGVIAGTGTYHWADGASYVGSWRKGKLDGQGVMTLRDGTTITGTWVSDELEGYAICAFPGSPEEQVKFHRNKIIRSS